MSNEESPQVSFTPAEKRGAILDLHPAQWIVLGSAATLDAMLVYVLQSGLSLILSIFIIAVSALVTFPQIFGARTAVSWIPDIWSYWSRKFSGHLEFRSRTARKIELSTLTPIYVDTIDEGPLTGLRFFNYNGMGIVHNRTLNTYTAVIEGQGRSFETLDESDQISRMDRWGVLLAGMSRENQLLSRFQWVESGLPADPSAPQQYIDENATVDVDDPARQSLELLVNDAGPGSREHHTYIAIQIGRGANKSIKLNGGGDLGAGIVLTRQVEALQRGLTDAEIEVERTFSARELGSIISAGFDPEIAPMLGLGKKTKSPDAGTDPTNSTPLAANEHWNAYHAGMWHITGWIAEWPRRRVRMDFLSSLIYYTSAARRLSITYAPSSPAAAMRQIDKQLYSDETNQGLRERAGLRTTTRRKRQQQAAEKHDEALADGAAMDEYVGHVTISAATYEDVEAAWDEFVSAAAGVGIEVRRMKGRQVEGFMATLPLGLGIPQENGLRGLMR